MWESKKWVFGCGMFSLISGSVILIFQSAIFSYSLNLLMRLNSKSYIYDPWSTIPADMPTNFTFFNWTNHKDFLIEGVKPKFEEIGPYRFLQTFYKVDNVENDNDTVTYRQIRSFRYDNNMESNGNLSDKVITINYISIFLSHHIRNWLDFMKDGFSQYLSVIDPNYYFETTVDAETYAGNDNFLMELMNYFDFISPEVIRMDHFGWLKMRDGDPQFDGVYNVGNGVNRQFDVFKWNYESTTHAFDKPCNKVQGSTGELHTKENKEYVDIFISDVCRYVRLYFDEEVVVDGIIGNKYSATKRTFDNGTIDPYNKCFCAGECYPSGLLNATSCKYGLNLFFSLPHFYNGDESLVNAVEGLNSNKSVHEAYIVIEPNTKVCLDFRLRAQINVRTENVAGVSEETYPQLYFPLFWIDQTIELPEYIKDYIRLVLNFPYIIIAIGIVLTLVGSCLTFHSVYKIIEPYRIKNSCINNRTFNVILESVPLNQNKNMC